MSIHLHDGAGAHLLVGPTPAHAELTATDQDAVEYDVTRRTVEVGANIASTVVFTSHAGTSAPPDGTGGYGQVIGGSIRYRQRTPAATWTFTHPLGRTPQVTCYIADGEGPDAPLEQVDTSVVATDTNVVVTWPYPMSGELIVQ